MRQEYLFRQVLYQIPTRRIFPNTQDQEIEFVISEFNPKRRRIIGDRKQLLVAKKVRAAERTVRKNPRSVMYVEGTVKNVTDFGAFIDLGGADGLLHISEMSWGRVESPKKVFKVGDQVRVFIKDINENKIALSMKFPAENPWNGRSREVRNRQRCNRAKLQE